jgi:hypothetical protein
MTATDLINKLRIVAHDTPSSNLKTTETPVGNTTNGKPDGVGTKFRLQHQNIVTGSVFVTMGPLAADYRLASGFTLDAGNGILSFATAPASGLDPFFVDYNWQWFTDAEHKEFLDEAAANLSAKDPTLVVAGLIPALMQFALSAYYNRLASRYAPLYSSTGGQTGHQIDVVTKSFENLAKDAFNRAVQFRDDYYKRQGQREAPASQAENYNIDPYTPIR